MSIALVGILLIIVTGFVCLFIQDGKKCTRFGAAGMIAGSAMGLAAAIRVLWSGTAISLNVPWQVPYGSFYVEMDGLSALFLIPVFIVCSIAAVYGCGYMTAFKDRRLGIPTFFFNLLAAGMAMVVMARNGVLFLVAWEVMSLASYFLVTFEDEHESVRQAGWIYLVATHIGTAFLLAFFVTLGKYNGTMDFAPVEVYGKAFSFLFLLALVGFGTKAGIMPMHVWLPEAHPAAPSPVSAVMSGVMIKMGIYGIIRTLTILPDVLIQWGWLLIALGVISGILGILFALAQHDIKRMLAYSSVENIGIILIGLGLGIVGMANQSPTLAVFGFAGALLHVINHSLFKSLLFMGAGAVVHATGTRCMDVLGGLMKRMPRTAGYVVLGAIAICGLPPLNGFIGEFLLYYGSFVAALTDGVQLVVPTTAVIAALAVIGGFALAAFTKVFGIVFLGEPRTARAAGAHEASGEMTIAMGILAAFCVLMSAAVPWILPAMTTIVAQIASVSPEAIEMQVHQAGNLLCIVVIVALMFTALVAILAVLRHKLLSHQAVTQDQTWGCGYAAPTPRMQYSSSSFAQPIVDMFKSVLGSRHKTVRISELFPRQAEFESDTPDVSSEYLYRPIFKWMDWFIGKMRWVQYGVVQVYVLYIALTLIILLVWKLR